MQQRGAVTALLLCACMSGCQLFTAGEKVSEPDPAKARAARSALESASAGAGHGESAHGQPAHGQQANAKEAPSPDAPAETATASHVLIRYAGAMRTGPEITRTKDEAKKLAEQVAKKAAAPGADFAAIADQYTEDPSGKGRGGKLGTFPRGRMVPEFDKATFDLAPGQSSGVIETAFGYHIIYREK